MVTVSTYGRSVTFNTRLRLYMYMYLEKLCVAAHSAHLDLRTSYASPTLQSVYTHSLWF